MVICVSSAFCSTDQEKGETARSLYGIAFRVGTKRYPFGGYRETWTRERRRESGGFPHPIAARLARLNRRACSQAVRYSVSIA